jgi:transcriptional repressor NF-X1
MSCHPPSFKAPECPYSPSVVTRCPCGKYSFSGAAATSHFGHSTKLIRTACTDPIPTCLSLCEKPLDGCTHTCGASCHTGPCPPCSVTLIWPCRCGSTTRSTSCSAAKAETESTAFLCNKPCGALRACGHHHCTRLCCPLANILNPTSRGKKKVAGNGIGAETVDAGGWHLCDMICGKLLSCGNHHCEERDHRGPCPPCFLSSFEEVYDHSPIPHPIGCADTIYRLSVIVGELYWSLPFHAEPR